MERLLENVLTGLDRTSVLDFAQYSISSRGLWDSLPAPLVDDIVKKARDISFTKDDYIPLSLFRDFRKTGNRMRYEDVYFAKRRKLSCLVIAQCARPDEDFMPVIEEGIWAILSEPAWVIPPHNSYVRDTEQLDTPLTGRPILDLFACETGEIMALTACCLSGRLNPVLEEDIWHALEERIARPYITDHFWWMGASGPLNNWSPWCTQNVLIATLSNRKLDEKTRMKIVKQATTTLDSFMESYSEDGGCDEGASYYHAAALALFGALTLLEKASGRDFSPLFGSAKVRGMAGYIEDVFIAEDLYLNYADCSPKAGTLTVREYLFAKATGNEAMAHHAALDVMKYGWQEDDNSYNLFYKLLALANYREVMEEAGRNIQPQRAGFKYFSKTELAIYREKDITFSIKGGNNAESHNHNDVGSIILYKGTRPLLVDIGVETYTKTTFSKDRYTLRPMQSSYHNLVNFPPVQQKDGSQHKARVLSLDENGASFDLRGAYPADERLTGYVRTASFDREANTITVTEDIESTLTPVLSLISQEEPVPGNGTVNWKSFGIDFSCGFARAEVEVIEITDARLRKAWPERLYRTLVTLTGSACWTIRFKD